MSAKPFPIVPKKNCKYLKVVYLLQFVIFEFRFLLKAVIFFRQCELVSLKPFLFSRENITNPRQV